MIDIERRTLYNLLRMNWIHDPQMPVEAWQVEDYRATPIDALFERLKKMELNLDKAHFIALAEETDTPEELADSLIGDEITDVKEQDQIYLITFELWRRLTPEKPSLSIFCDELDHQIFLYDQGIIEDPEHLQDTIADLQVILNEHVDENIDPDEAFASVSKCCANDLETFLYDFISEQIDENNDLYGAELLDAFDQYVEEKKWFEFLRIRLLALSDTSLANKKLKDLFQNYSDDKDLDFNLEVLASLVQGGNLPLLYQLIKQTAPLLKEEGDFQDLLHICSDFYHCLDHEPAEKKIQAILTKRSRKKAEELVKSNDPDIGALLQIIASEIP